MSPQLRQRLRKRIRSLGLVLTLFHSFYAWSEGSFLDQDSRQAIVVLTEGWNASQGTLVALEKANNKWKWFRESTPVTVGHRGLGWGVGLHGEGTHEPLKREGDHRAPAGVFFLEFGFGASPFRERSFPYFRITDADRWVDDPTSRFYNQWIALGDPRFPKDWKSAEIMNRKDGRYDHVIVVSHNRNPTIPGRGSAIFLHSWIAPGKSTIGCTAMETREVKRLLQWLDLDAKPILIQLPKEELGSLPLSESLKLAIQQSF